MGEPDPGWPQPTSRPRIELITAWRKRRPRPGSPPPMRRTCRPGTSTRPPARLTMTGGAALRPPVASAQLRLDILQFVGVEITGKLEVVHVALVINLAA